MAIEFHCPYCTATIRVADQLGGHEGRCPKCETRLIVPRVSPPIQPPALPTTPGQSEATDSMAAIRPGFDTTADTVRGRTVSSESEIPAVSESAEPGPMVAPLNSRQLPFRIRQLRQQSRRRHRILVIGVPVICFLILFGILAAIMTSRLPELSGQLTAESLTERSLPRASIGWSQLDLTVDERTALAELLRTSPESFVSTYQTCRFFSADNGIEVELTATGDNAWFVVDPASQMPLVLWDRRQQAVLGAAILLELRTQGTLWAQRRVRGSEDRGSADGPNPADSATVRDSVGLNAHIRSLGYALEAVAGARVARCAHEDDIGRLYFLLPRETQSFMIRGRTLPNGEKLFPGEYTVLVAAARNPESGAAAQPSGNAERPGGNPEEPPSPSDAARSPGAENPEASQSDPSPEQPE